MIMCVWNLSPPIKKTDISLLKIQCRVWQRSTRTSTLPFRAIFLKLKRAGGAGGVQEYHRLHMGFTHDLVYYRYVIQVRVLKVIVFYISLFYCYNHQ